MRNQTCGIKDHFCPRVAYDIYRKSIVPTWLLSYLPFIESTDQRSPERLHALLVEAPHVIRFRKYILSFEW